MNRKRREGKRKNKSASSDLYHRQHKALVVIGVLADEINPTRRVRADGGLLVKFLGENLQRPRSDTVNVRDRCCHARVCILDTLHTLETTRLCQKPRQKWRLDDKTGDNCATVDSRKDTD